MAKSLVKKPVTRRDKNKLSRPHEKTEISRKAPEEIESSDDDNSWTALFPPLPVAFVLKAIKIEPISFLEMENESMPQRIIQKQDSGTSRQKKKPKITNIKAALRMKQKKRIENPERYKENIADLPEYMYE
ncbi:hypothetical protein Ddc_17884 [Ditylenchus destructor]|nr:hypothetical protein Ddc_17884 [Ditylenchus destructor]